MRTIDGGRFFDEPNYPRVYSLLRAAKKNLNAQEYPYDWERWEEEPNLLIDSNVPVKTQVLVKHFNSCLVVLKEMFEEWGVVASNGFLNKDDDAILEFSTKEKAELCFNTFHGYEWKGSKLDVKLLKSTQPFGPLPSASTKPSNIKTTT
uniref:RRM domain-containing protein n=1 Tax=Panagrolaimus sp. PS1159 TaxID=55785 RepID=A0AC35FGV5_9BILA